MQKVIVKHLARNRCLMKCVDTCPQNLDVKALSAKVGDQLLQYVKHLVCDVCYFEMKLFYHVLHRGELLMGQCILQTHT